MSPTKLCRNYIYHNCLVYCTVPFSTSYCTRKVSIKEGNERYIIDGNPDPAVKLCGIVLAAVRTLRKTQPCFLNLRILRTDVSISSLLHECHKTVAANVLNEQSLTFNIDSFEHRKNKLQYEIMYKPEYKEPPIFSGEKIRKKKYKNEYVIYV
jgi:hypothetical protein